MYWAILCKQLKKYNGKHILHNKVASFVSPCTALSRYSLSFITKYGLDSELSFSTALLIFMTLGGTYLKVFSMHYNQDLLKFK